MIIHFQWACFGPPGGPYTNTKWIFSRAWPPGRPGFLSFWKCNRMWCLWKLFTDCDWTNWNDRLLILSSFLQVVMKQPENPVNTSLP